MNRSKHATLTLVTLSLLTLWGCNTAAPPPAPNPTPAPTPTPDPAPAPAPTPNPTPGDVPYAGTWVWAVTFADQTTVTGAWVISQPESEPAVFTGSGEGPFVVCEADVCPEQPAGLGVMGTLTEADGTQSLAAAFFEEGLSGPRLVARDTDNALGTELEGLESFVGAGAWLGDDGTAAEVAVGMALVPPGAALEAAQNKLAHLVAAQ